MTVVAHSEDWRDHAACAGMSTDLWFPEPGASTREAIAICNQCPVKAACLEFGLSERFGLYGGKTAKQRKTMRRGRVRRQKRVSHGTPSGHAWHLAHGEKPCWACADANSRYQEVSGQLRRHEQ